MVKSKVYQRGFTLIELSIVMVIVAIIFVVVVSSQNIVKNSRINATVSQVQRYHVALNTFYSKYNALPGDIESPDVYIQAGLTGGDGDGTIEDAGFDNAPAGSVKAYDGELREVWEHLSESGIMFGVYTSVASVVGSDFPESAMNDGSGIVALSTLSRKYLFVGVYDSGLLGGVSSPTNGLQPIAAFGIDSKMDDGMPGIGSVLVNTNVDYGEGHVESGVAGGDCTDAVAGAAISPSNEYKVIDESLSGCLIQILLE